MKRRREDEANAGEVILLWLLTIIAFVFAVLGVAQ